MTDTKHAHNKKDQHRRSVETLGLSGNGNNSIPRAERYIKNIVNLINGHTPKEPYSSNVMERIAVEVENWRSNNV